LRYSGAAKSLSRKRPFLAQDIVCSKSIRSADGITFAEHALPPFCDIPAWESGAVCVFAAIAESFSLDAASNAGNV